MDRRQPSPRGCQVRPVDFTLHVPRTAMEAVVLLGGLGDDAVVLAGGQTLMPLLNMRVVRPAHVVDLGQVGELDYIGRREDGVLTIGAITRQRQLANSSTARSMARCWPTRQALSASQVRALAERLAEVLHSAATSPRSASPCWRWMVKSKSKPTSPAALPRSGSSSAI